MLKSLLLVICVGFVVQSVLNAETFRARIAKVQGDVYVIGKDGEKRTPQEKKHLVSSDETIVTEKSSKALVQFADGGMSVLDENSSLLVENKGWMSQISGKIYYIFRKLISRDRTKNIKTRNATIGVRGTTFIVDMNKNYEQIALQEGRLNIESADGEFKLIRKSSEQDDFSSYKQQIESQQSRALQEFEDYKTRINKDFFEYVKSFEMQANQLVELRGVEASEKKLDQHWQAEFEAFAEFSGEYARAYK